MPDFRRLGQLFDVYGGFKRFGGGKSRAGFNWQRSLTFEAGLIISDPTGFDAQAGANLAVNAAAAMRGNYGFSVGIPAVGNRFGRLDNLPEYATFTESFLFDPNSIVMANADIFEFCNVNDLAFNLIGLDFGFTLANGYFIRMNSRDDTAGALTGVNNLVNDEAMHIEAEYKAADFAGANNGFVRLYINGVLVDQFLDIDNDGRFVQQVRIGVIGVDPGTSGTLYYDNYRYSNQIR
jgi:hypothetical protein